MIKFEYSTAIALLFILNSCIGQESKQEVKHYRKLEESRLNTFNAENSSLYSDTNNQISQVVRTIFQDRSGDIWFGGEGGAFKLSNSILTHIDSIKSELGKKVTVKDIAEDEDGKIWIGHTNGISSVDGNIVTNYYESDGLLSNDVWSIATDRNNQVWIGTIDGLCLFNGQGFTNFRLPEGKIDSSLGISSTKMIHNIFEDSSGTLWFSSNAGLFSYGNDSLTNVSEMVGIETNFVNQVIEDNEGILWVSTKIGLYNLSKNSSNNITAGKVENGKGIGSIAEDKDGNIWFVSNQHYLYTYNGNELVEFQKSQGNKGPVVFQIFKDQSNRLWLVGFGGAYRLENGKFINITMNGPW